MIASACSLGEEYKTMLLSCAHEEDARSLMSLIAEVRLARYQVLLRQIEIQERNTLIEDRFR